MAQVPLACAPEGALEELEEPPAAPSLSTAVLASADTCLQCAWSAQLLHVAHHTTQL